MTDQKTLKRIINEQRSEIQRLKKERYYTDAWKHQFLKITKLNIEFAKQIETAKQIWREIIEFGCFKDEIYVQDLIKDPLIDDSGYWIIPNKFIEILNQTLFGEKIET